MTSSLIVAQVFADPVSTLAMLFIAATFAFHVITQLIVLYRLHRRIHPGDGLATTPGVTLLRPLCGLDHGQEETVRSSFTLNYQPYEIIFCVASPDDAAVPLLRRLMAAYPDSKARLLIGDDTISDNPKLNNLVKGWEAARHDWIVMSDSNVLLPPDFIERLLARWEPNTGLVTSPSSGIRPEGLWGALEGAFLNSYQARWQLAADQVGLGFAQGKTLFWRRDVLEDGGGLAALGQDMAEDVASTKLVRRAGLKVRVARQPFPQLIGRRSFRDVWSRQLRWSRVRRLGFPLYFMPELLTGFAAPLIAALWLLSQATLSPQQVLVMALAWYGSEFIFTRLAGWPHRFRDLVAIVIRDGMIPVLWGVAWASNDFVWRGNEMAADKVNAGKVNTDKVNTDKEGDE